MGKKLRKSLLGTIIDAAAIIAVAAGTIGPIGFLGLQASYGLQELFGVSDVFTTQLAIIVCVVAVSTISAVTGIDKGIQIISNLNVRLAIVLMAFILLFGPGGFIMDSFVSSFGFYVNEFIPMSTYRGDTSWLGSWTIFFLGMVYWIRTNDGNFSESNFKRENDSRNHRCNWNYRTYYYNILVYYIRWIRRVL